MALRNAILIILLLCLTAQFVGRLISLSGHDSTHHQVSAVVAAELVPLHELMHFVAQPHSHDENAQRPLMPDNSPESRLHVADDVTCCAYDLWATVLWFDVNPPRLISLYWAVPSAFSYYPDSLQRPPRALA